MDAASRPRGAWRCAEDAEKADKEEEKERKDAMEVEQPSEGARAEIRPFSLCCGHR